MRRLSAEEASLWRKVVESVRPIEKGREGGPADRSSPAPATPARAPESARPAPATPTANLPRAPGNHLDSTWDRKLARGLAQPDLMLDLHGHDLATAYQRLDDALERGTRSGARLLLLITGKPRTDPVARRGAIRSAVGDWLAASRHASEIAAVRNAHPRHGGAGALYIVLRRKRQAHRR